MRLLIVGQGSRHSGYARVLRALASHLAHDFDVCYFLLPPPEMPHLAGVTCIAPTLRSDPHGLAELPAVLDRVRPDVVLACHDPAVLAAQTEVVRANSGARVLLYLPLEWRSQDPLTLRELSAADCVVCYTATAERWILAQAGPHVPIAPEPIPHGVDRLVFGPVDAEGSPDRRAQRATARAAARRLLGLPGPGAGAWDGRYPQRCCARQNRARRSSDTRHPWPGRETTDHPPTTATGSKCLRTPGRSSLLWDREPRSRTSIPVPH